jgi:hypothetical protein
MRMEDHGGRAIAPSAALGALAGLDERQRALRRAYTAARYGWPETPASAYARRPETFGSLPVDCRATRFLDASALR